MILLICLRGFGDAVIVRGIARELVPRCPNGEVHILTLDKYRGLFSNDSEIVMHYINIGVNEILGNLFRARLWSDILSVYRLRHCGFKVSIDWVGDIRERIYALLISSTIHMYPLWNEGHPVGRLTRWNKLKIAQNRHKGYKILALNVYDIHREMIGYLDVQSDEKICSNINRRPHRGNYNSGIIAIHPFASQESRMWVWDYWRDLITRIEILGFKVRIYCSKNEVSILKSELHAIEVGSIEIYGGEDLALIEESLSEVRLSICLDSFFVHLCHASGVKAIMINGSNNPSAWAPPSAAVVCNGFHCSRFPCYNVPKCKNDLEWKYRCIRTVQCNDILEIFESIVGTKKLDFDSFDQNRRQ